MSEGDLEKAKLHMANKESAKRCRSSMSYWLAQNGMKDEYDDAPIHEKKKFILHFASEQLKKEGEKTMQTEEVHNFSNKKARNFRWMSLEILQREIGKNKANNKVASGKLLSRPDPDTGLDDEDNREYKIYEDVGGEEERTDQKTGLKNDVALKDDAAVKDATDMMSDARACIAGGEVTLGWPKTQVKLEVGDPGSASNGKPDNAKPDMDTEDNKTIVALDKEPKKVLRQTQEIIVRLKEMFGNTENTKFCETLHQEITKLLPKLGTSYKKVEKIVTDKGVDKSEPVLTALGTKLDEHFTAFNEVDEWYCKMMGSKFKKQKNR